MTARKNSSFKWQCKNAKAIILYLFPSANNRPKATTKLNFSRTSHYAVNNNPVQCIVCIATGYELNGRRSQSSISGMVKNFFFFTSSRPALGPSQPLFQKEPGALSPGVKLPKREADHSPPPSAEVKKTSIYRSPLPIRLHGVVLNNLNTRTILPFTIFTVFSLSLGEAGATATDISEISGE
jgi:hypothetical protein